MVKLVSNERDIRMNKRALAILTAFALSIFLAGCSENSGPATDDDAAVQEELKPAPEFDLEKLDGTIMKSADLKGKVIVVDFWATWCAPCLSEIPNYNALQEKFGDDVVFLGVTLESGSKESVISEVKELNIKYPLVMGNDEMVQGFGGVIGYPTTFMVTKDWKIYQRYLGVKANKKELLDKDIQLLLAQAD